jgi:hypothetical protein
MYANVVHADIHDRDAAKQGLDEQVIPQLKQAPGFVCAYFVRVDDSHGVSVAVFETEEQARAGAPQEGAAAPGVTIAKLQVGEVIASA